MKETPEERSRIMRAVKGADTVPELMVRRLAHQMGYRYRLHRSDLPGKPDMVFAGRSKIIFVHGCFWHGHGCRRGNRVPKGNRDYWVKKITRNRERDQAAIASLTAQGWKVEVFWECEMKDRDDVVSRLQSFLG